MCTAAGQLTFPQIMKMFRNELLDLNEILNYIKLAPHESAATPATVSATSRIGEFTCLDVMMLA